MLFLRDGLNILRFLRFIWILRVLLFFDFFSYFTSTFKFSFFFNWRFLFGFLFGLFRSNSRWIFLNWRLCCVKRTHPSNFPTSEYRLFLSFFLGIKLFSLLFPLPKFFCLRIFLIAFYFLFFPGFGFFLLSDSFLIYWPRLFTQCLINSVEDAHLKK